MPREVRKRRHEPSSGEEEDKGAVPEAEEGVVISSDEEEDVGKNRSSDRDEEDGKGSRSRSDDDEDGGSSDEDGGGHGHERRSHHHRHKKSKKSKKSKKKKKKHKHHKHRSSHRHRDSDDEAASNEDDDGDRHSRRRKRARRDRGDDTDSTRDDDKDTDVEGGGGDTDREGGSTPELPEIDQEEMSLEKKVEEEDEVHEVGTSSRRTTLEEEGEIKEVGVRRGSPPSSSRHDGRRSHRDRDRRDDADEERDRERDGRQRDRDRRGERDSRRGRRGDEEEDRRSSRRSRRSRSPREGRSRPDSRAEVKDESTTEAPKEEEAEAAGGSSKVISLSVEETNKLRASLGLAPLKIEGQPPSGDAATDAQAEEDRRRAEEHAVAMGGTLIPNSKNNEVHKPPENWSEKSQADKIREKIKQRRQKREQESKLLTLKKLGDSDSDGDEATNWVEKQKQTQRAKLEAAKRAKMLEELDDEFGVGSIVEEETKKERSKAYDRGDLSGLTVEHSADRFREGQSVILTLKDADVLDGDAHDTLVNPNLVDDEKAVKRQEDIKKAKIGGYNAYEAEEVDELTGELIKKNMLDKYDEEIDGEKKQNFMIGARGEYNEDERREREKQRIKEKLQMKARTLESLESPQLKIASDYLTHEEAAAKFKKPKKKKKVKKKVLKADDLIGNAEESFGSRGKGKKASEKDGEGGTNFRRVAVHDDEEEEGLNLRPDLSAIKVEGEDEEDDAGLGSALEKARRMKLLAARQAAREEEAADLAAERVLREVKSEPGAAGLASVKEEEMTGSEFISTFEDQNQTSIVMNETAEFCRNLGSRQMSHQMEQMMAKRAKKARQQQAQGNDAVDDDLLDFEESLKSRATRQHEERRGRWEEVADAPDEDVMEIDSDDEGGRWGEAGPSSSRKTRTAILEEEPDLHQGVAAAIKLASSKGYWEKEEMRASGSTLKHLQAKNYTIDDKVRSGGGDDDRGHRRERYGREGGGATVPFQEKEGWAPNVKLEYIDDNGRLLSSKEAFRYLSHKFHGKGSGKMKTEKRMKKIMEEGLMKNMSSTDTPLQTLDKLKKKQAEAATPYVVLTGSKLSAQDLKK